MKKNILLLVIFLTVTACGVKDYVSNNDSKYTYFLQETADPQHVVDSLLQDKSTDFHTWTKMNLIGVRYDSTRITTYTNWVLVSDSVRNSISVTCYGNTDTCTVKSKVSKVK